VTFNLTEIKNNYKLYSNSLIISIFSLSNINNDPAELEQMMIELNDIKSLFAITQLNAFYYAIKGVYNKTVRTQIGSRIYTDNLVYPNQFRFPSYNIFTWPLSPFAEYRSGMFVTKDLAYSHFIVSNLRYKGPQIIFTTPSIFSRFYTIYISSNKVISNTELHYMRFLSYISTLPKSQIHNVRFVTDGSYTYEDNSGRYSVSGHFINLSLSMPYSIGALLQMVDDVIYHYTNRDNPKYVNLIKWLISNNLHMEFKDNKYTEHWHHINEYQIAAKSLELYNQTYLQLHSTTMHRIDEYVRYAVAKLSSYVS
jgi:hypothetical protein